MGKFIFHGWGITILFNIEKHNEFFFNIIFPNILKNPFHDFTWSLKGEKSERIFPHITKHNINSVSTFLQHSTIKTRRFINFISCIISLDASNPGSKVVTLGSNFVILLDSKNYFFWVAKLFFWAARLFIWAANFIRKGSRFYRDWQQFLLKWAANIFNEIIFYIK